MTSSENGAEPLLRLRGVSKNFGPVQALVDVDLDIRAGEVTALIGDNGAGKSVMIKCIAGIHAPERGEILWDGKPVRIRTPREAAALGIETVYQDLALCNNLDIVQNMFLGREREQRHLPRRGGDGEIGRRDPLQPRGDDRALDPPAGRLALGRPAAVGGDREGRALGSEARDHGRADGCARRRPDEDGARPHPQARRAGARGAVRLPQHERRLRGRRPDHRALSRPRGRAATGERARPADRGRPDDDREVGAARQERRRAPDGQGRRDRRAARVGGRPDRGGGAPGRARTFRPSSPPGPSASICAPRSRGSRRARAASCRSSRG